MTGKRICVLKTGRTLADVSAVRGDFETWIASALGLGEEDVEVASVHEGEAFPDLSGVAGVVVTGSPGMVTDREDWSEASAAWLGEVVRQDSVPVLGICYGHQLIAHGLGGEVAKNPRGREMGTVEVRFAAGAGEDAPVLEAGRFPVHMSHVESVVVPPKDAEILADTDLEPHAALRFGPRQWGVQFHPEFDPDIMRRYVEARRAILDGEGFDVDGMMAAIAETADSMAILRRFGSFALGR